MKKVIPSKQLSGARTTTLNNIAYFGQCKVRDERRYEERGGFTPQAVTSRQREVLAGQEARVRGKGKKKKGRGKSGKAAPTARKKGVRLCPKGQAVANFRLCASVLTAASVVEHRTCPTTIAGRSNPQPEFFSGSEVHNDVPVSMLNALVASQPRAKDIARVGHGSMFHALL